jgi:hypothetical protein
MGDLRRVIESPIFQGKDERIIYTLTTTPWGGSPAAPVVAMYDGELDVTTTNCTGSASVSGDVITTPVIHSLTKGKTYRMEVQWTYNGNTLEAYCEIKAER